MVFCSAAIGGADGRGRLGAAMVTSVAGPNEVDNQCFDYGGNSGYLAAINVQHDLYAAIKGDPTLSSIPVAMFPLAFPSNYVGNVGDQTANCDLPNMHDYYDVDNSGGQSYSGIIPVALRGWLVTVSLPPGSSGAVYDPINNGTTPVSTFSNVSSVGVSLNDAPLLIEVDH